MNPDHITTLTAAQQEAVSHTDGPCLVIAGAGTGKTMVITQRIANLIQKHQVDPERIVALTFTDKAAREMEGRVDELLPYGLSRATISTFHSYCADLLGRHAFLIGIDPASKLMSEADEIGFLRQHLAELPTELYKPARNPVEFLNSLTNYVSKLKDEDISPEKLLGYGQECLKASTEEGEREQAQKTIELAECYATVEQLYRDNSLLSYADLIYCSLRLLREYPSVLLEECRRIDYLLIDEFQDTNLVQNEVARLLAGKKGNIMAVGDDDQAIYSFRGANLANIMGFTRSFPKAKVITLTDNYRSSQPILDAAYQLIQNNNPERLEVQEKVDKRLVSHRPETNQPEHWHFETSQQEFGAVVERIKKLVTDGYNPNDIAVLVRTRSQVPPLESALQAANIPYQINGTSKFFNLPTVQRVMSYLRFLADPQDDLNLFFLVSGVPFSFDVTSLKKQLAENRYAKTSLWETLASEVPFLREHLDRHALKPSAAFLDFINASGWYAELTGNDDQEAIELLFTLYQEITAYEQTNKEATVMHYVAHVNYLIDSDQQITLRQDAGQDGEGVQVMTIHKSKGLEFRAVFVINLVEGRFPARNRSDSALPLPYPLMSGALATKEEHTREERRLAYVAFTRAKEYLYLTSSESYEDRKTKAKVSTFVTEAIGETVAAKPSERNRDDLLVDTTKIPVSKNHKSSLPSSISPSALDAYETCPVSYQYQYVWNVRVPSNHFANFGTSVHNALRAWFAAKQAGDTPDLDELYRKHWISGGYEHKRHELERYAEGLAKLQAYVQECDGCQPIALETTVRAVLPDGQVLHGKIDRIDQLADGRLSIIDYKTKEKPEKRDKLLKDIPLATYLLAMEQQGKDVAGLELHYVMAGEKIMLAKEDMRLDDTLARAEKIVSEIGESLAEERFKAKPDKNSCMYCDYRDICPYRYGKL